MPNLVVFIEPKRAWKKELLKQFDKKKVFQVFLPSSLSENFSNGMLYNAKILKMANPCFFIFIFVLFTWHS